MTTILLEENLNSIEFKGILEKGKRMVPGYNFNYLRFLKDSSVLGSRIETHSKLQSMAPVDCFKVKFCKNSYEVRLFLKQTDCRRKEILITEEIEMDRKDSFN